MKQEILVDNKIENEKIVITKKRTKNGQWTGQQMTSVMMSSDDIINDVIKPGTGQMGRSNDDVIDDVNNDVIMTSAA